MKKMKKMKNLFQILEVLNLLLYFTDLFYRLIATSWNEFNTAGVFENLCINQFDTSVTATCPSFKLIFSFLKINFYVV